MSSSPPSSTSSLSPLLARGDADLWSADHLVSVPRDFPHGSLQRRHTQHAFTLDTWKGTSKMRPCFAAVRQGGTKVSDQMMYDQLRDLRAERAI